MERKVSAMTSRRARAWFDSGPTTTNPGGLHLRQAGDFAEAADDEDGDAFEAGAKVRGECDWLCGWRGCRGCCAAKL
jgi:hypothetical protein